MTGNANFLKTSGVSLKPGGHCLEGAYHLPVDLGCAYLEEVDGRQKTCGGGTGYGKCEEWRGRHRD
jgi:hypothetical protein